MGCYAYDLSRQRVSDGYVVHDDYAVLPVYLSSALGAKASEVDMWSGAVFAVTFFVSGLLGPVWGVLADRKSRKLMGFKSLNRSDD